jgi:hypothetical protein
VATGEVTSRLSADCEKVSDQVQLNVNVFLRSLIQVRERGGTVRRETRRGRLRSPS